MICHECTKLFDVSVFKKWLPNYELHSVGSTDDIKAGLSPHMFAWPCRRPRSYVVLTRNETCKLVGFQEALEVLFEKTKLDASAFLVAPDAICLD